MISKELEKSLEIFDGYAKVSDLKESCRLIPDYPGIYVVVRNSNEDPVFLAVGTGGLHKGMDLNYPVSTLKSKWIPDEQWIYIGKTDSSLRKRIRTYMSHGKGKDAAHRGGRAIWQLADSDDLIVAWKALSPSVSAREIEIRLISEFKQAHGGRLPYANWVD